MPSLQFNQYSPSVTIFNIRGVSQNGFTDHLESPVAVYTDEVYVSSTGGVAGQMYDLERVEVLRGPQGTLFGRNATGGLIHLISKAPTRAFEGFVRASYGRFNSVSTEGGFGGPITDDIRARLSFATNYSDGYVRNLGGRDNKRENNYAMRLQVLGDLSGHATSA